MSSTIKNNRGFAIIEALFGITIIAIILIAFQGLISYSIRVSRANQTELQANLYLIESVEISKALEKSITNLSQWDAVFPLGVCNETSKCMFVENGDSWEIAAGEEAELDGLYSRDIDIFSVNDYTKRVVATVEWNNGLRNRKLTLENYVYQNF